MARIRGPQDLNENVPYNRFEVDQSTARVQGPTRGATIINQTPASAAPETINEISVSASFTETLSLTLAVSLL